MALRYFATNRDMENLGRRVERKKRKSLETGGYYFVDMRTYMDFYLGEVDSDQMPPGALVESSQKDIFGTAFLGHESVKRVVVCVHGFNVELFEAFTWFRVLTDTMRHLPELAPRIVTDPDLEEDAAKLAATPPDGGLTAFIG